MVTHNQSSLYILTGPESSGKTTLATQLCDCLSLPLVPEIAREYLQQHNNAYQQSDLPAIAKQQHEQEQQLAKFSNGPIICDTDLLVLMIWSERVYGMCDPYIKSTFENSINQHPPRYYFLCDYRIPWQEDSLRENPHDRDQLYVHYLEKLRYYQLPFICIEGSEKVRLQTALSIIRNNNEDLFN